MKQLLPGIIVAVAGAILGGFCYKRGYNNGVDECSRILRTAINVKKAEKEKQEDES